MDHEKDLNYQSAPLCIICLVSLQNYNAFYDLENL